MKKIHWLIGASMLVLGAPLAAQAQTANTAAAAAPAAATSGEIVIYGRGQTRQIETLTPKQIEAAVPGTSPIKVLETLPGVNYQSSDAFGAYEWATRISVRGFNQNQLGFTLDGVPLGDMSYANYNGLHISRAITSENLGKTELAQGAGALGTASSSNLGGTIEFTSRDPSSTFGVLGSATYGSNDTQHEFIRVDTGDMPGDGRGYISFANQRSDKWKGDGRQEQQQINTKWVQPIGSSVKVTGFFNYSNRAENDYQDLSLGLIKNFGYKLDNISNNWPAAVALANSYEQLIHGVPASSVTYPLGFTLANTGPATDPWDAAYFNASGLRKDELGGLKVDWDIIDGLTAHLQGYAHHNQGQGTWFTPYTPSPGYVYGDPNSTGAPISVRTTEYDIAREGAVGSLEYKIAGQDIEAGFWYEDNHFNNARRFYGLNDAGNNRNALDFQQNPFYTQWYGKFDTKTTELHLQDNWKVTDDLKVYAGFKSLKVDITANQPIQYVSNSNIYYANGSISSNEGFLPQAGVNYKLPFNSEIFADYSKNMRAFVGSDTAGPFATSQAGFDAIKHDLKPETSQTGELGYRYHTGTIDAVLTGYYVKFDHRLLSIAVGSAIVGNPAVLANVGSVTSKGFEAAVTWKFIQNWSIQGSYAYDRSTYDNNTLNADGSVNAFTAGKTVVDSPDNIANVTLAYDDGSLFGAIDTSYMSKRYFTYTNDESVPGRTLVDLSFGYRFHQENGWLKGVEIQGNVTNLFNEKYIATIGTNGFGNSGDNQTLQAGAPTQAFVTVRKQF